LLHASRGKHAALRFVMGKRRLHSTSLKCRDLCNAVDRAAWRQYRPAMFRRQRTFSKQAGTETGRARFQGDQPIAPVPGGPNTASCGPEARETPLANPCRSRPEISAPMTQTGPAGAPADAAQCGRPRSPRPCGQRADARASRGWTALPDPVRQPAPPAGGGSCTRRINARVLMPNHHAAAGHAQITAKAGVLTPAAAGPSPMNDQWLRLKKGPSRGGQCLLVQNTVPAPQTEFLVEPQRMQLRAELRDLRRILRASSTAQRTAPRQARLPRGFDQHTPARAGLLVALICIPRRPIGSLLRSRGKWVASGRRGRPALPLLVNVLFLSIRRCGAAVAAGKGLRSQRYGRSCEIVLQDGRIR